MSTIVQRTAFNIVCGVERNFLLPTPKKRAFAVGLLRELLAEQGVEIEESELLRQVKRAEWKCKLQTACPFCPTLSLLRGVLKAISVGGIGRVNLVQKLT